MKNIASENTEELSEIEKSVVSDVKRVLQESQHLEHIHQILLRVLGIEVESEEDRRILTLNFTAFCKLFHISEDELTRYEKNDFASELLSTFLLKSSFFDSLQIG